MESKSVRRLLTILMDLLVIAAVAQTARLVVSFFGTLASRPWAEAIIKLTDYFKIPFGVDAIKTPYGGVFDVDAALTVGFLMLVEWALSMIRSRE